MTSGKWRPSCLSLGVLTPKQRERHGCVVSTVATDALMLKHQAISIHNADLTIHCIGPVSYKNIALMEYNIRK